MDFKINYNINVIRRRLCTILFVLCTIYPVAGSSIETLLPVAEIVGRVGPPSPIDLRDGEPDELGTAIAINGNTMAIGAPRDTVLTSDPDPCIEAGSCREQGRVDIFQRDIGTNIWNLIQSVSNPTEDLSDEGLRLFFHDANTICSYANRLFFDPNDLSGGITRRVVRREIDVAGCYQRDQGGEDNWGIIPDIFFSAGDIAEIGISQGFPSEGVRILGRNIGGQNNWGELQTVSSSTNQNPSFGIATAVSASEQYMVVSAPFDGVPGARPGALYVFFREFGATSQWSELQRIVPSMATQGQAFGANVAISRSGDLIVAQAARTMTSPRQTYIYQRSQNGLSARWNEVRVIPNLGAIAIFRNEIIIGNQMFSRNQGGINNWGQVLGFSHDNPFDALGSFLTADRQGDTISVGAGGSVFIYQLAPTVLGVEANNDTISINLSRLGRTFENTQSVNINYSSAPSDPLGDGLVVNDVTDINNYRLISAGLDEELANYTSQVCALGLSGDDQFVEVNSVEFNIATSNAELSSAKLNINNGENLPLGGYLLVVCGSSSSKITSISGLALDGNQDRQSGDDFLLNFSVQLESELICIPVVAQSGAFPLICL